MLHSISEKKFILFLQVTLGQFDKAAALFEEALQANPDDWTSLQQYLDCMMPITAAFESAVKRCPAQTRLQNTECLDELKNCKASQLCIPGLRASNLAANLSNIYTLQDFKGELVASLKKLAWRYGPRSLCCMCAWDCFGP